VANKLFLKVTTYKTASKLTRRLSSQDDWPLLILNINRCGILSMVTYLFSFSDHINIKCCEQVLKAELEDQEKSLKAAVALQEMPYGFLKNAAVEVTDRKIAYIRFLSEYF
jgi:hypothetical protein